MSEMFMSISRKNIGDQFWSQLYGISTYNHQSTCYRKNKSEFAWCRCSGTGNKHTLNVSEWASLDWEHSINSGNVRAEQSSGKYYRAEIRRGAEQMKKGQFNNGDVGEFWLWVFCAVSFFTCLLGVVFGGGIL